MFQTVARTIALLIWTSASFAQDFPPVTVKDIATVTKQRFAQNCQAQSLQLDLAKSPGDKALYQSTVELFCRCLPQEIDSTEKRMASSGSNSIDEFQTSMMSSFEHCIGNQFRRSAMDLCRNDDKDGVPASDKERYCECVQSGMNGLTDKQISRDTQTENANFRAKVRARSEGKPDPVPEPTEIGRISTQCKAPPGQESPS